MKVIGRKREADLLTQCLRSGRPEFMVIYGRRRVGKTYLIREFFNKRFSFYATGLSDEKTAGQLKAFHASLLAYGERGTKIPADWFEAFSRLQTLLSSPTVYREPVSQKIVVFLDELPWMDTARSDFRSALDYFWNSFGSGMPELLLIACGSATSWIVDNLLKSRKGFHNRITKRIHLMPFSLRECEELLHNNDIVMTRSQIIECYMTFGGIPHYLNLLTPRLSLAQNIEELCFREYGELFDEYENLFYSLFKKPGKHLAIVETLAESKSGMTRQALAERSSIGGGSVLTKDLQELEQCGFIRKYTNYTKTAGNSFYQLTDPFVLFCLRFLKNRTHSSWMNYLNTPSYHAWRGNAFEVVCLDHIPQIKMALGISGVESNEYAWHSKKKTSGAQIDLIIDRNDGVVNLCEMKYTNQEYGPDQKETQKLMNRLSCFQEETGCEKAVHITLISANGVRETAYSGYIQSKITGDDLFA